MTPRPPPPPLWLAALVVWLAVWALLLAAGAGSAGCAATPYQQARCVSQAAAAVADDARELLLARQCAAEMAALGRTGTWTGGHCLESGPRAGTPGTPDERAAQAAEHARWTTVRADYDAVAAAHDRLRAALDAPGAPDAAAILAAMGGLAAAYTTLAASAAAVGVTVPALLGAAP